jgi:hypothetical protein
VKDRIGRVDLILLCGVVEHLPLTIPNLPRRLLRALFEMLDEGGCLYIYDTPNRLWPYDSHTTGLMGIPWTAPGSPDAYQKAVQRGRYTDSPHFTPGPPRARGVRNVGRLLLGAPRVLRGRGLRMPQYAPREQQAHRLPGRCASLPAVPHAVRLLSWAYSLDRSGSPSPLCIRSSITWSS